MQSNVLLCKQTIEIRCKQDNCWKFCIFSFKPRSLALYTKPVWLQSHVEPPSKVSPVPSIFCLIVNLKAACDPSQPLYNYGRFNAGKHRYWGEGPAGPLFTIPLLSQVEQAIQSRQNPTREMNFHKICLFVCFIKPRMGLFSGRKVEKGQFHSTSLDVIDYKT